MSMRVARYGLCLVLAACGTAATTNSGAHDAGSAEGVAGSTPADSPFVISPVATFNNPWAMAFIPGSTTGIVTEKAGRIWLVDVSNGLKRPVNGGPRVASSGQGGLLDVALSPTFAADRQVYLTYAEPSPNGGSGLALERATFVTDAAGARLAAPHRLWHDPAGGEGGQFGGVIAFAPDGHSLFLTSGERQRFTPAQDPNQPLGKILHLTLDGKPAPDNPMRGKAGAPSVTITNPPEDTQAAGTVRGRQFRWPGPNLTPAETWSSGHRNPYGLTFDGEGRLWETEMGPRGGDELNLIRPGNNYGWPLVSEGQNYNGVPIAKPASRHDLAPPILYWVPSVSPTTLLLYSGRLFPQWRGSGFIGTLSGESLIRVTFSGDRAQKADRWRLGKRIRWVGQGPDGAIYLLEDGDDAHLDRLTPAQLRR